MALVHAIRIQTNKSIKLSDRARNLEPKPPAKAIPDAADMTIANVSAAT